jgi:hypothetical protein
MSSLVELVAEQLDDNRIRQMSQIIGADETQTRQAVGAALPAMVAMLARNAADDQGSQQIHAAVSRDHDGSLLDQLGPMLAGGQSGDMVSIGTSILKHMFGAKQSKVENGIGKMSGLDAASITKLLALLAPIVMAALGKKQKETGLAPTDMGGYLRREEASITQQSPQGTSFIGRMLDQDGDGDFDVNDALKLGMNWLMGKKK